MSELTSSEPIRFAKAYSWLAVTLVAGFILLATFGAADRGKTGKLESFAERTAVGDEALFQIPAQLSESTVVAILRGQPLYLASLKKAHPRDTEMFRAGYDEERGLIIYSNRDPRDVGEKERQDSSQPEYFLKCGTGKYIKVTPKK